MMRARLGLGVVLMGLSSAPAMATVDCLGPATEARQARNAEGALALCTAALADPTCEGVRVHLEMLCALTRHDIARRVGGEAWCVARDAYAPLRASASESYAAAARAGFEETDLWCRIPSPVDEESTAKCPTCVCRTCPVVEPVSHWWWTGPGLGLGLAGGVLVGWGIDTHLTARSLAEDLSNGNKNDPNKAAQQRWNEGARIGLFMGGGLLLMGGAVLAIFGHVASHRSQPKKVTAGAGPSGITLGFEF